MRVEILANDRASFVLPMAEGLERMLKACGATTRIHKDGLAQLMRKPSIEKTSARAFASSSVRLLPNRRNFQEFVNRLRGADLIVVVISVPVAFSPSVFPNIELLRKALPEIPIVNYDLHYLPTLDSWSRLLLRGERTRLDPENLEFFKQGSFGLERYDWYLMASVGSHTLLPPGEHPFSLIGLDMDDGTLYPEQTEFEVLIDFEITRQHYLDYRKIQLEAVRRSGLKYHVLEGKYSRDEIRAIYRRSSALLIAHAEAFGLPVVECQLAGCKVWTPDGYWVAAHWLGDDYYSKREPRLTSNFVVYENEVDALVAQLRQASETYDPEAVRETLLREQPIFAHGDRDELSRFLDRVSSGAIHSELHREHQTIGRSAITN